MMNVIKITISIIILLISNIAICFNVSALEEVGIVYGAENNITISSNHVNRLSFGHHYVKAIIGDDNKYSASLQNNNSEVFLSSKVEGPACLHLSFLLNSGYVVDVAASILDKKTPSIINFIFFEDKLATNSEALEINQMLDSMVSGKADKYYIHHINNPLTCTSYPGLSFIEKIRCRYEEYVGIGIEVSDRRRSRRGELSRDINIDKDIIINSLMGRYKNIKKMQIVDNYGLDKKLKKYIYVIYKRDR